MHLVMFTTEDGKAATHQTDTLDEALRFVEHIKNNEGVSEAHLYRMVEVPLEVKAYYKVELATQDVSAVPQPTAAPANA